MGAGLSGGSCVMRTNGFHGSCSRVSPVQSSGWVSVAKSALSFLLSGFRFGLSIHSSCLSLWIDLILRVLYTTPLSQYLRLL